MTFSHGMRQVGAVYLSVPRVLLPHSLSRPHTTLIAVAAQTSSHLQSTKQQRQS